jgi:hypothetical protein
VNAGSAGAAKRAEVLLGGARSVPLPRSPSVPRAGRPSGPGVPRSHTVVPGGVAVFMGPSGLSTRRTP